MDCGSKDTSKCDSPTKLGHKNRSHVGSQRGSSEQPRNANPAYSRHVSRQDLYTKTPFQTGKSCVSSASVNVVSYKDVPPFSSRVRGVLKKHELAGLRLSNAREHYRSHSETRTRTEDSEVLRDSASGPTVHNREPKELNVETKPKKSVRFALDLTSVAEPTSSKTKQTRNLQRSNHKRLCRQKLRSKKPRSGSVSHSSSANNRSSSDENQESPSSPRKSCMSASQCLSPLMKVPTTTTQLSSPEVGAISPQRLEDKRLKFPDEELMCQSFPGYAGYDSELSRMYIVGNDVTCDHIRDEDKGTRTVRTQTLLCLHHPKCSRTARAEACSNTATKATMTDITLPPSLQGTPLTIDGVLYIPLHTALRTGLPLTMWERIMQKAVLKVMNDQKYKKYHRRPTAPCGRHIV